jgi:hypothetical protein
MRVQQSRTFCRSEEYFAVSQISEVAFSLSADHLKHILADKVSDCVDKVSVQCCELISNTQNCVPPIVISSSIFSVRYLTNILSESFNFLRQSV